jgi:hypothetical protein
MRKFSKPSSLKQKRRDYESYTAESEDYFRRYFDWGGKNNSTSTFVAFDGRSARIASSKKLTEFFIKFQG